MNTDSRAGGTGWVGCAATHPLFGSFIWQEASFVLKYLDEFDSLHTRILVGSTASVKKMLKKFT